MYLLILCRVFFCPVVITFLYLSSVITCIAAGVPVSLFHLYRTTVTIWLKVFNLLCFIPNLHDNIRFYKVAL